MNAGGSFEGALWDTAGVAKYLTPVSCVAPYRGRATNSNHCPDSDLLPAVAR